jgi:hypothetical protein
MNLLRLLADPVKFLQSQNPVRIFHKADVRRLKSESALIPAYRQAGARNNKNRLRNMNLINISCDQKYYFCS